MADENWTIGRDTFPRIAYLLCRLWTIVAVGVLVMVIVTWCLIFVQNTHTFQTTMDHYLGNDPTVYGGNPNAGFVDNTNIPKHLAGVVFCAVFEIAMIVFCCIALASEIFWKYKHGQQVLEMFYAEGLYDTRTFDQMKFMFIFANAFLKLFIVAATGSMSFTGLNPNDPQVDTPLFCLYSVMILLGSIPLTMIAQMVNITELRRPDFLKSQEAAAGELKEAKESAGKYKKERDEAKAEAAKYKKAAGSGGSGGSGGGGSGDGKSRSRKDRGGEGVANAPAK